MTEYLVLSGEKIDRMSMTELIVYLEDVLAKVLSYQLDLLSQTEKDGLIQNLLSWVDEAGKKLDKKRSRLTRVEYDRINRVLEIDRALAERTIEYLTSEDNSIRP